MFARGSDMQSTSNDVTSEKTKIRVKQHFVPNNITDVFSTVEWDKRSAEIKKSDGTVAFHADNLLFPKSWSQNCTGLVAEKYFRYVPVAVPGSFASD